MRLVYSHLIVWLLLACNAITGAEVIGKDLTQSIDNDRDKRAIDFGLFVRNLLLNSAAASSAKDNISRNLINFKATIAPPRRRPTTTTTTTAAPFIFNKVPFNFPFDLSIPFSNKFNTGGNIFDYNDYGGRQPMRPARRRRPTTSTTTTTAAPPPPPPPPPSPAQANRRPIQRRPNRFMNKPILPLFDYYDDYDYNYDEVDSAPSTTAPATSPNPAPSPSPTPTTARPQNRPTGNRAQARGRVNQLRNQLVYQYKQPSDTSTNSAAVQTSNDQAPQTTNNNNDETSTNTNDYLDDANSGDDVGSNAANAQAEGTDVANNNPNIVQDYNDSNNNANSNFDPNSSNFNGNINTNIPPNPTPLPQPPSFPSTNYNYNVVPFRNRFDVGNNFIGPHPSFNFGPSSGFQYSHQYDFNPHYSPSSPAGYSVRYY